MKVKSLVVGIGVLFSFALFCQAEESLLEQRQNKAVEKFVTSSRKCDGNYSTISLRYWQRDIGYPVLSSEDVVRKVLNAFEEHYEELEVVDYLVFYYNKPGTGGGIEYDFLMIHHQGRSEKTYRLVRKDKK